MKFKERQEIGPIERAERDAERLDRLRESCEYVEEVPSIPASYPKCNHPLSKWKVCACLEDCPKREDALGGNLHEDRGRSVLRGWRI